MRSDMWNTCSTLWFIYLWSMSTWSLLAGCRANPLLTFCAFMMLYTSHYQTLGQGQVCTIERCAPNSLPALQWNSSSDIDWYAYKPWIQVSSDRDLVLDDCLHTCCLNSGTASASLHTSRKLQSVYNTDYCGSRMHWICSQ